jgi:hypothetical protein
MIVMDISNVINPCAEEQLKFRHKYFYGTMNLNYCNFVIKLKHLKILLSGIIFLFAGSISIFAHPIHVSVCNIEFSQQKSIISIKLYSDDFSIVIQNNFNETFTHLKADESPYRDYISDYVNSNLQVFVNNRRPLKFVYDYSETDHEAIWLYFKVNKVNMSDDIKIINTLMLDLYEDQTNLMIINYEGKQDGFRFNNFTRELDIQLK